MTTTSQSPAILIGFEPNLVSCVFSKDLPPIIIHAHAHAQNQNPNTASSSDGVIKINIDALSFLNVEKSLSSEAFAGNGADQLLQFSGVVGCPSPYEVRIFGSHTDSEHDHDQEVDEEQLDLLETLSQMRGLKERLLDASLAVPMAVKVDHEKKKSSRTKEDGDDIHVDVDTDEKDGSEDGVIKHFLEMSDAVVQEFSSAIRQQKQKLRRDFNGPRKRKRDSDGTTTMTTTRTVPQFDFSHAYFDALYRQCMQVDEVLQLHTQTDGHAELGTDGDGIETDIILNDELTQITIVYKDRRARCHELIGELPLSFPSHGPNLIYDLPNEFDPKWTRGGGGLASITEEFIKQVCQYQELWDELDDLDANAWVLEPSLPARRSCSERRVALRTGLSIHFSLDIDHPRSTPLTMRFIGSMKDVAGFRESYKEYISSVDGDDIDGDAEKSDKSWSEDLSVRQNLERCFGFQLPSPATTEKTDYIVECGICYTHRIPLDDQDEAGATAIPNISCSNTSCARSYHESCLSEWLHSLPGAKSSFGRIFGQCPYCCDSISVKISNNYD